MDVELMIYPKEFLAEKELGGVILYCKDYRIVLDNTLKSRLDLCFSESTPDIRHQLFVSLK